jgi:uncharacterized iron-regulated protein
MNYRWYDQYGIEVRPDDLPEFLAKADVVLFGEQHGNPVIHGVQQQIARELFAIRGDDLLLGAEMFEADNQLILDEYLCGSILHRHLVAEAKVWDGYETDYRPLVDFARDQGLGFIATNIPRRYANLVAREGIEALEKLSAEAKRFIAPLPIRVDLATPGYREMLGMNMGHGMGMEPGNFVAAQAVKDATMAHFILSHLPPDGLMLHFNGDYHSKRYGGLYWYLKQANRDLAVITIASVAGEALTFCEEYRGLGDLALICS